MNEDLETVRFPKRKTDKRKVRTEEIPPNPGWEISQEMSSGI